MKKEVNLLGIIGIGLLVILLIVAAAGPIRTISSCKNRSDNIFIISFA